MRNYLGCATTIFFGERFAASCACIALAVLAVSLQPVVAAATSPRQAGDLEWGPYLQHGTATSMTICWGTDVPSDSQVRYGSVEGSLNRYEVDPAIVRDHCVTISGLSPDTKYLYDVGSTDWVQGGGTPDHFFVTSPLAGSHRPFTVWVLGDGGNDAPTRIGVMNAMLAETGPQGPDFGIYLGEIVPARGSGAGLADDSFRPYAPVLGSTVMWSASAGDAASRGAAYHSFDYGNAHFIALDSFAADRSPAGPMATWLEADLAATAQDWIVAYWHHPPYSKGAHDSDTEPALVEMRENILPILEDGGVDVVLTGHSYDYERSYLIDGVYGTPTPTHSVLVDHGRIVDDGDGMLTGDGPYVKSPGPTPHEGTVYVGVGEGGQGAGGTSAHPVMHVTERAQGSCLLEFDGDSLALRSVRVDGTIADTFTIRKENDVPGETAVVQDDCFEDEDCDDLDPCTVDVCNLGTNECEHTDVDCSALDDICTVGVCNQATGECEADPLAQVILSLPDGATAEPGATFLADLVASPALGKNFGIDVEFDPAVLQGISVSTTPLSDSYLLFSNVTIPGKIGIVLIWDGVGEQLSGSGPILVLEFLVVGGVGAETELLLTKGVIEDDLITSCLDHGSFVVCDNSDADDDGVSLCQGDCDDTNEFRFPDNPEVCDGIDNDCNDDVDDGIAPTPTECGQGVCASTGQLECQDGTEVDTCTEGTPTGTDEDCNGVDENCDGTADDGYTPTPTECGEGECAGNTGEMICSNGGEVNTCDPLAGAEPESCDGLDNNCDGGTDEGFANTDGDLLADCVDPDDDNDGVEDGEDCAPLDDTASVEAIEVAGVLAHGGPTPLLTWSGQGTGFRYDVVGGLVQELQADEGAFDAACLSDDEPAASFSDLRPAPASESAYYYLIRAQNACGAGPYGFATSLAPRIPIVDCP